MPTVLQFRRGTTAQNNAFTGTLGELSVNTTLDTIRVHDGSTAGGFELLRADISNGADSMALTTATASKPEIKLTNTADDATSPIIVLESDRANPADNDVAGEISFKASDSAGTQTEFAQIQGLAADVTNGTEDGKLTFTTLVAGSAVVPLTLDATGATIVGGVVISNAGNIGSASDSDAIAISSGGDVTLTQNLILNAQGDIRFADSDSSNWVAFQAPATIASNITWTLPNADATSSGYALVSNASGTLSWAAAGATVTQDNSTNTAFNLYYATTTSGALTALKYDGSDMTFNPSTSTLACTTFSGALSGNATTATEATNITAVANNSTNETTYPTFVDGATGTQGIETDTGFSYNPSTGTLTTTILAGTSNAAKYSDLAENYTADESIEPGIVVCFGGEEEITVCDVDMCQRVAGVISTDPGYLMNAALEDAHPLALTGRVPCKVTGTVRKGDMMVSAGNGKARAETNPVMGSVIGKALEDSKGDATIEVVIGRL